MIQADLPAKTHIGIAIPVVSGVQVRSSPMEVSPALFAGVGQTGRNTNLHWPTGAGTNGWPICVP